MWDKAQMLGKNDDMINVSVYRCLIQMVPCDFELAPVLKEGEPQAVFRGKIIFCGETMPIYCAFIVKEVTTDLNIEVL